MSEMMWVGKWVMSFESGGAIEIQFCAYGTAQRSYVGFCPGWAKLFTEVGGVMV